MVSSVGSLVAGYRIDALVGRGGGGVVYRATHLRLGRTDALKLLAPELAADREFERRFEREALMAGALDHPNIVPVYDAGKADGVLYLAMRLVEGPDLATVIECAKDGLDPVRTCAILRQVASALDTAHARGLVHRDVKPANILIDRVADGSRVEHVYLSDFGLTRRFEGSALSGTMIAGTPGYMAPERFSGVLAAPAIDVYALGCVAYACLTGAPPFGDDSWPSAMAAHLNEEPPRATDRRAELPAGVDDVLAKAVAKQPAVRYPSCKAFVAALCAEIETGAAPSQAAEHPAASVMSAPTIPPPPVPPVPTPFIPTTRRRKIVGTAAVAAVLVAALIALVVWKVGGLGQSSATDTPLVGMVDELAIGPDGDVYLSTVRDSRVFAVEPSGAIRAVAGIGTEGSSGDGGPATKAQLSNPQGLAVDGAGNLYIADTDNHRIRKIDSAGTITTVAGNGTQGSAGDGGPALLAQLQRPTDVAFDRSGNLYVAETAGHRIRKIDPNGQITTVAGTGVRGFSGDGGSATQAQLNFPLSMAVDDAGNLYIVDNGNERIRKVDTAGTITLVAGNGREGRTGDGGPATAAELSNARDVAVDRAGNLYIADTGNDRIRKIDTSGKISTIAGSGIRGFSGDDGPAGTAHLAVPAAVSVDRDGNVYIASWGSHRVRKVDQNGTITTVAGAGPGYPGDGGPATQAILREPGSTYVDQAGRLYIVDAANHRIRLVQPGGEITTIAGNGIAGFSGDGGPAIDAQLNYPSSVTVDPAGNVYIADKSNHRVRKVTPDGKIRTIAGTGQELFSGNNGRATETGLSSPTGLVVGGDGSLYIAAGGSDRILQVDPAGVITTVAGNGTRGFSGDGGPAAQAQFFSPTEIHLGRDGNLYITDQGNDRIRRVDPAGIITTVAGNGVEGFSGDGGPARDAQLNNVLGVAVDGYGANNLYVADHGNNRVRKVDPSGRITTVAGTGAAGSSGDGGPATWAQLNGPAAVSIGANGDLYIAELAGNRVRKVDAAGVITTVAGPAADD